LLRTALGLRPVRSALDMLAERKDGSAFWRRARGLLPYAEIVKAPAREPGKTPTTVPTNAPMKQATRLTVVRELTNPLRRGPNPSMSPAPYSSIPRGKSTYSQ